MAEILLAHSYFLRFDPKSWGQKRPYPPLGTLYAASVLRDAGHTVSLFDPILSESEHEINERLESARPDITIFYEDDFNYLSKMCLSRMREACFIMTRHATNAGSAVVVHGSDATDNLEEYFAHHVDATILGEGENTLAELVSAMDSGDGNQGLSNVNGIAYISGGSPVKTAPRPLERNLDRIPFPARDLIDIEEYRNIWMQHHGIFGLNVVTTRGCPFHCNWCAKPIYGQVYHTRSPRNVIDEMLHLTSTYTPDSIWFCDDILGLKPGWLEQYADLVDRFDCRIPFTCQTRADILLRDNNVDHMKRAGASTVWIGAESGSQKILDAMDKGTTVGQIHEATRELQHRDVGVAWFLQFGYLGETRKDVRKTLDMLRKGIPDDIGISISYPLPGTLFHDRVKQLLGDKRNWTDSADLALMYPGTFHPSWYKALHSAVHREFRLRQGLSSLFLGKKADFRTRRILLIPLNFLLLLSARIRMLISGLRSPMQPELSSHSVRTPE